MESGREQSKRIENVSSRFIYSSVAFVGGSAQSGVAPYVPRKTMNGLSEMSCSDHAVEGSYRPEWSKIRACSETFMCTCSIILPQSCLRLVTRLHSPRHRGWISYMQYHMYMRCNIRDARCNARPNVTSASRRGVSSVFSRTDFKCCF